MKRLMAFLVALVFVLAVCLTGCAGQKAETTTATDSQPAAGVAEQSQAQPSTESETPEAAEQKAYKIGVTLPVFIPHYLFEGYGCSDEGEKLGCEVTVVDCGGYEYVEKQINQIQDFIASGMDAILIAATDPDGVANAVDEAIDQGLVVVSINSLVNSDKQHARIHSDDVLMGQLQAQLLAQGMDDRFGEGTHKVVMVNAPAGNTLAVRGNSFREEIETNYPNIEILGEQFVAPDPAKATAAVEDFLQTYDEIDGIFCWCDAVAIPISHIVAASGRDILVTCMDVVSGDTRAAIKEGLIYGTIGQRSVQLGRVGIQTIVDILNGKEGVGGEIFVPVSTISTDNIDTVDHTLIIPPSETW